MKIAECHLVSVTPYGQNKYHSTEKKSGELAKDYEERTWRERCHFDQDGLLFIPPMAFANNIKEAAKFANLQIPGNGRQTYTKHFEAGVLVSDPLSLNIRKEDVEGEWLFLPSDGRRGGGKRVEKCLPVVREWQGDVTYYILDDIITQDIFEQVLDIGGSLIGVGRFRPRNLGYYGRFRVESVKWTDNASLR